MHMAAKKKPPVDATGGSQQDPQGRMSAGQSSNNPNVPTDGGKKLNAFNFINKTGIQQDPTAPPDKTLNPNFLANMTIKSPQKHEQFRQDAEGNESGGHQIGGPSTSIQTQPSQGDNQQLPEQQQKPSAFGFAKFHQKKQVIKALVGRKEKQL